MFTTPDCLWAERTVAPATPPTGRPARLAATKFTFQPDRAKFTTSTVNRLVMLISLACMQAHLSQVDYHAQWVRFQQLQLDCMAFEDFLSYLREARLRRLYLPRANPTGRLKMAVPSYCRWCALSDQDG